MPEGKAPASTSPMTAPAEVSALSARVKFAASPAALSTGNATKFWLELVAYPPGSARSLWLFVGGAWRHLDNPSPSIETSVQSAFEHLDKFEVAVWYTGDVIVGLVVRTK